MNQQTITIIGNHCHLETSPFYRGNFRRHGYFYHKEYKQWYKKIPLDLLQDEIETARAAGFDFYIAGKELAARNTTLHLRTSKSIYNEQTIYAQGIWKLGRSPFWGKKVINELADSAIYWAADQNIILQR